MITISSTVTITAEYIVNRGFLSEKDTGVTVCSGKNVPFGYFLYIGYIYILHVIVNFTVITLFHI